MSHPCLVRVTLAQPVVLQKVYLRFIAITGQTAMKAHLFLVFMVKKSLKFKLRNLKVIFKQILK